MSCFSLLCDYAWKLSVMLALFYVSVKLWRWGREKKFLVVVNGQVFCYIHCEVSNACCWEEWIGRVIILSVFILEGDLSHCHWQALCMGILSIIKRNPEPVQLAASSALSCCAPCLCVRLHVLVKVMGKSRSTTIDRKTSKDDSGLLVLQWFILP